MTKKFYITTPIYYVNDVPHIGHAYTTIAADVVARYKRLKGYDVFFLTGTDEHGQKVEKSAAAVGVSPKELADRVVIRFKKLWHKLQISNSEFIRTTDERHYRAATDLWERVKAKGDIYIGNYEDWYCTPCETFWTSTQIMDGRCPDCSRAVEKLMEPSYFFRMSRYQDRLLSHIRDHPDFIQPEGRRREITAFIKDGLKDLSISRTSFAWGIPVPGDREHVMYVWFDALTNYLSATGYPDKSARYWPADLHVIGKDILRFHTVYWPAFLMSAGIPLPERVFAHGWWTVNGEKMSKSRGNVVDPFTVSEKFGVDQFRYFLMKGVSFGNDGDFSMSRFVHLLNNDLSNGIGNLLSRTLGMLERYFDGRIPVPSRTALDDGEGLFGQLKGELPFSAFGNLIDSLSFSSALDEILKLVDCADKYIEETSPWIMYKEGRMKELSTVLYSLAESIRIIALYLYPFMPSSSEEIWRQLGIGRKIEGSLIEEETALGGIEPGRPVARGASLFPRIDSL